MIHKIWISVKLQLENDFLQFFAKTVIIELQFCLLRKMIVLLDSALIIDSRIKLQCVINIHFRISMTCLINFKERRYFLRLIYAWDIINLRLKRSILVKQHSKHVLETLSSWGCHLS